MSVKSGLLPPSSQADHALASRLLPPELPWLYLVTPLPAMYLMGHDLLNPAAPLSTLLLKAYLPFLGFGGSFHLLYRYAMPALLRQARSRLARGGLHIAALLLVVPVVSALLIPIQSWVEGCDIAFWRLTSVGFIFSSAFLFPGLVVQGLRRRARRAEHQALSERKAALEAQLAALQARTDPHFLFNSINTVASLIPEDPELAERTLERLADLFRYALEAGRVRTVALRRELAMVSDYLALQSARFGPRLDARLSVETELDGIEVPPLLLQPLVENAIVHGMASRRGGKIRVTVRREQDLLALEVLDDGPGLGLSQHTGSRTGVAGVMERLRLHYDRRAELSMDARPDGGCRVRLLLPLAGAT